ncbi:hypothetical protein V8G54_010837 [Vigna mungo]|uniref:Uncharacterized protein n=1 Tax=Vigna mungo TaxID=3915 RepID=A0AAQ3NXV1_VIGMU
MVRTQNSSRIHTGSSWPQPFPPPSSPRPESSRGESISYWCRKPAETKTNAARRMIALGWLHSYMPDPSRQSLGKGSTQWRPAAPPPYHYHHRRQPPRRVPFSWRRRCDDDHDNNGNDKNNNNNSTRITICMRRIKKRRIINNWKENLENLSLCKKKKTLTGWGLRAYL